MTPREELLLKMYDQMFNDINRHIMVVWQSIGVLIGAFAVFALIEKNIVTPDIASCIIITLCLWLFSHLYDASYWYNRNLIIIANIERQFLSSDDLTGIHYYFGKHRPSNKMIQHLSIQFYLAIGISFIVLIYHFSERVYPGIYSPIQNFEPARAAPYILLIIGIFYIRHLKTTCEKKYKEFLDNSPGIEVNSTGKTYGVGHGFTENKDKDS